MALPAKIHLIYGNQQLQVEESVATVTQQILGKRPREWCLERFDASELLAGSQDAGHSKIEAFQVSCATPPLFSDRKLIRVDHFEKISKGKSGIAIRLFEALKCHLASPPNDCWFLLTASVTREQDFSKALIKSIKKEGKIQKFVSYENNVPSQWVRNRAQKKGIRLSESTAHLLITQVGNDLADCDQALEKLCLFLGIQSEDDSIISVSESQLLETLHAHQTHSAFYMVEVLTQKKLSAALSVLEQQLRHSPRDHVKLFMLIVAQFRRLLKIRYLLEQHATEQVILGKLKMHPFLGKQLIKYCHHFNLVELERIFVRLAQMDLSIKFNPDSACTLLEDLFFKICTGFFRKHSLTQ